MSRLIVVACGAGINTSTVAEDIIKQRVEQEGYTDVVVKRILMADIEGYIARPDLVMVVSMMKNLSHVPGAGLSRHAIPHRHQSRKGGHITKDSGRIEKEITDQTFVRFQNTFQEEKIRCKSY